MENMHPDIGYRTIFSNNVVVFFFFLQELTVKGCEPFSIPVLAFKYDNEKELSQKLQDPNKYGGVLSIQTFSSFLNDRLSVRHQTLENP